MTPLGIVVPTRWEAAEVLRRFAFKRAGCGLYRVERNGRSVRLCVSGVGGPAAWKAAGRLCSDGAGELLSMGFCGALVPDLHVGDVVTHRLVTVSQPVSAPADRRALSERTQAVAADMETQAVIEAGTRWGVPIRVLRVVSDTVDDDLTPLFGSSGIFSTWRIALRLLNPAVWLLAARLRRNSAVAQARLAAALSDPRFGLFSA